MKRSFLVFASLSVLGLSLLSGCGGSNNSPPEIASGDPGYLAMPANCDGMNGVEQRLSKEAMLLGDDGGAGHPEDARKAEQRLDKLRSELVEFRSVYDSLSCPSVGYGAADFDTRIRTQLSAFEGGLPRDNGAPQDPPRK